jgi:regulatory protein
MGRITALKLQVHNAERVSVFLDGEYAFGLHVDLAARLHRDQELDAEAIAALQRQDATETAYSRALNYLTYRPRSEFEVAQYLKDKGVDEQAVADVLDRLRRAGLVDDRAFARFWVNAREATRPKGAWGLRAELRQKRIADQAIDDAVSELDEGASALSAAERKAVHLAHLDEATFRTRLLAFLQRRGFGYDVARQTVDRLWDEHGAGREPAPR